jgi:hypothetical protein
MELRKKLIEFAEFRENSIIPDTIEELVDNFLRKTNAGEMKEGETYFRMHPVVKGRIPKERGLYFTNKGKKSLTMIEMSLWSEYESDKLEWWLEELPSPKPKNK